MWISFDFCQKQSKIEIKRKSRGLWFRFYVICSYPKRIVFSMEIGISNALNERTELGTAVEFLKE